jgi:catechol 2,3-dioxygenase-like lactoylglutathione lyase family enzyme
MPRLAGLLETALYVADVSRSMRFYRDVLGLSVMTSDNRFCAFDVAPRQVLLLFVKGGTLEPIRLPGGVIPPHDGDGRLHFAFAVDAAELPAWERHLQEHGVAVEGRVDWSAGGRSVYFRDPDGHLVELATPGIWANY